MQITPASNHNAAAIKTLLQSHDLPFEDISPAHLEHFFVVQNGNQVDATVGLELCGEFGLLRSLAVAERLRGQRLGIQLVARIEAHARSQQISALYLLTTTAEQFFAKLDYHVIPRSFAPPSLQATAEFQSICPDSATCMQKQL